MFGDNRGCVFQCDSFGCRTFYFGEEKEKTLSQKDGNSNIFSGTVSGIDGTDCCFCFDSAEKLNGMYYMFPRARSRSEGDTRYKTLQDGLVRKYGESEYITLFELFPSQAYEKMLQQLAFSSMSGYKYDLVNAAEWMLPVNGGYVEIDIYEFCYGPSKDNMDYYVYLGYRFYTDREFDQILAKQQAEIDSQKRADDEKKRVVDDDL